MCHSKYFTSIVLSTFHISTHLYDASTIVIPILELKELKYIKFK